MTAEGRPDNGQEEQPPRLYSADEIGLMQADWFGAGWQAGRKRGLASARPGAGEQQREQVARWLADAIATYTEAFMSAFAVTPAADYRYMAEDFIESCDVIPELLALLAHTDEETR